MALRLYTKEDFEKELRTVLGLTRTDQRTATHCAWKTPAGKHVIVPDHGIDIPEQGERFPDNWLAQIYKEVERLG